MATTVGLISLGCSKNRVDSEQTLGFLRDRDTMTQDKVHLDNLVAYIAEKTAY